MAHPIPTAKTALKALLDARPAWDAVDIRDGQPTELEDVTRDMFWFEPTEIPRDAWASLGAHRRRIEFRLGFTIAVLRDGDDERATEDVVWALFEDLMLALKGDPGLGGTVQKIDDVTGRQVNEPVPQHWQARFTGFIACQSKAY
jgi:hypothetical protein